jgi:hypothetical protein
MARHRITIRTSTGTITFTSSLVWYYEPHKAWRRLQELHLISTEQLDPKSAQVVSPKLRTERAAFAFRVSLAGALAEFLVANRTNRVRLFESLLGFLARGRTLEGLESPFLSGWNATASEASRSMRRQLHQQWAKLGGLTAPGGGFASSPVVSFKSSSIAFLDALELSMLAHQGPTDHTDATIKTRPGHSDPTVSEVSEGQKEFCDILGDLAAAIVSSKGGKGSAPKSVGADVAVNHMCVWAMEEVPKFLKELKEFWTTNKPGPLHGWRPASAGFPSETTPPTGSDAGTPAPSTPSPSAPSDTTPSGDSDTDDDDTDDTDDTDDKRGNAGLTPSEDTSGLTAGDLQNAIRILQSAPKDPRPTTDTTDTDSASPVRPAPKPIDPLFDPVPIDFRDPLTVLRTAPKDPPKPDANGADVRLSIMPTRSQSSSFGFFDSHQRRFYLSEVPRFSEHGNEVADLGLFRFSPQLADGLAAAHDHARIRPIARIKGLLLDRLRPGP